MEAKNSNAETYDFVHPEHKIRSDWPVLNSISKKLAAELQKNMVKQFQFPITAISVDSTISMFTEQFAELNDAKILFEVSLPPMVGSGWLCLDRALVYRLAEAFFGGKGEPSDKVHNPKLSYTENRLCQYFINSLCASLPVAWESTLELKPPAIERITLDNFNNSSSDQVVVVCNYELVIADAKFNVHLIYSHSMLEPYQKKLRAGNQQSKVATSGFSGALKSELMNCEIDMHAVLAETKISLAEFLNLKAGDFIPLRDVENVSFKSNSKPLFYAKVGKSNGQVSANLSRWCTARAS